MDSRPPVPPFSEDDATTEDNRLFRWDLSGPRLAEHPGLGELGL